MGYIEGFGPDWEKLLTRGNDPEGGNELEREARELQAAARADEEVTRAELKLLEMLRSGREDAELIALAFLAAATDDPQLSTLTLKKLRTIQHTRADPRRGIAARLVRVVENSRHRR